MHRKSCCWKTRSNRAGAGLTPTFVPCWYLSNPLLITLKEGRERPIKSNKPRGWCQQTGEPCPQAQALAWVLFNLFRDTASVPACLLLFSRSAVSGTASSSWEPTGHSLYCQNLPSTPALFSLAALSQLMRAPLIHGTEISWAGAWSSTSLKC